MGNGADASIEQQIGPRALEHAGEDLPVPALDGHSAGGGHADHCFQAVDLAEVLGVVDAGACLDDICRKRRLDIVSEQELLACACS